MNEEQQAKYRFPSQGIGCLAKIPCSHVMPSCVTEDPLLPGKLLLAAYGHVLELSDLILNLWEIISKLLQYHLQLFDLFHWPLKFNFRADLSLARAFNGMGMSVEDNIRGLVLVVQAQHEDECMHICPDRHN